jgi:rsbT antagonist protein RsbS
MEEGSESARIPLQISQGCIVASVQVDLRPDVLATFQADVLNLVRDSGARALIVDLSGVQTVDPEEFEALRRTSNMARLMGARSILSGLNAGVVSSLVDLDVNVADVEATRTLDAAFALVGDSPGRQTQKKPRSHLTWEVEDADDPDSE